MQLLQLMRRESALRPGILIGLTLLSALATVVVIASVSSAAEQASNGKLSLRLAGLFVVAIGLYALVQNALMSGFATEVEGIIHRLRLSLFAAIRNADAASVQQLGRQPMFAAISQHTQTISRNLPLLIIGGQQLVLVIFICLYLATLSIPAFVLAASFCVLVVLVHLSRMKGLERATAQAMNDEGRLFDGLGGLLHGLKEVRMSAARSDALFADLQEISGEARRAKSQIKARWGREFALIQLAFYALVGLMVFVVPLFTSDFHEVALPGTMAALFLIGPVGTVATAIPVIEEAERALQEIRRVETRLAEALAARRDEAAEPLDAPVLDLALEELRFSYAGQGGDPGFSVGPLSARFERGQITFVTGGNGSGKSTLMQLLTGLLPAESGRIRVNGQILRPTQLQAWRDSIAAVFADYHLFAELYGVEEAALPRASALLERLEMADKASLRGKAFSTVSLSAGQRKRLALVAALLEDKPVLILDEWAADQDPHFRSVFYEQLLPALRDEGRILICVTHDDRWFGLADQVLHMQEGKMLRT